MAPLLLEGKSILQELCRLDVEWDEPVPPEIKCKCQNWKDELLALEKVSISRCYKPDKFGLVVRTELHHFSDASTRGYGQCSYLRMINDQNNIHCALVIGKSRVAPLKPVTIPGLELTAAVCSVRISKQIKHELEYKIDDEYFWTDSMVVLGYIASMTRWFHIFVANRVQEIQESTKIEQWRHVKTEQNTADKASRGMRANELTGSRWLIGPEFLWKQDSDYSDLKRDHQPTYVLSDDDPEVKKSIVMTTIASTQLSLATLDERICYFSSWFRAKRAVALCLLYIRTLAN